MKKLRVSFFLAIGALALAKAAFAGEGMWMPEQMPQLSGELHELRITLAPARLADLTGDPMGAVVSLGGCTASFVSPEGLIVTNHHCVFGTVQQNSTPERDLITNGFLAKTRDEELPAAGTKVWVTTAIEDVTARMLAEPTGKGRGASKDISDAERARRLDRREKELVAECEKPGGVRCRVSSFFEGSRYLRTTQAEISDVRLVYAPAEGIGDFGGEIDNFEWPRHTGDFGFYRAYVDGKPYHPKHWLKLSTDGVHPNDGVIVAGYPGRTFRYKTADEVRNYQDFVYPANIRYFTDVIQLLEERGRGDREVQIRNAARIQGLANSLKNYTSVSEGFAKDRIVEARLAREAKMRQAIANDPSLAKYANAFDEIETINEAKLRTRQRDLVLDWLLVRASPMMGQAFTVVRLAHEKQKKDMDRLAMFQEREWPVIASRSARAQHSIEPGSDRAVLRYFLQEAVKLPAEQRIKPIDDAVAAAGGIEPLLDRLYGSTLYGSTKIGSLEERSKMLGETSAQLQARHDAMLDFAASFIPLLDQREEDDLAWSGAMARLRPGYFEVLRKVSSDTLYPDANSTLRITIGRVEGYSPEDATWMLPQTTLRGVMEKESGKEPFASPKALLDAAADSAERRSWADATLEDVPVDFLTSCDSTGGNSGSPTLNAKGELVGLLFDGNYESIDSDFLFNPAVTRSIHVDVRYMLWIMDSVDGAHDLMRELGVEPRTK